MLQSVSFPAVAVGGERVSQAEVKTGADGFPQSRPATFKRSAVSAAVMRVSEEGSDPWLWNVDMGGVNPTWLPKPPIRSVRAFSPVALIAPAWNHSIAGQPEEAYGLGRQFWDLQGKVNPAQNSPTSHVTVVIAGHAGTDLTVSPSAFVFTSSAWADQTATLTAGHDEDAISDELTLTIPVKQGRNESSFQRSATIVDGEITWELTSRIIRKGAVWTSPRVKNQFKRSHRVPIRHTPGRSTKNEMAQIMPPLICINSRELPRC